MPGVRGRPDTVRLLRWAAGCLGAASIIALGMAFNGAYAVALSQAADVPAVSAAVRVVQMLGVILGAIGIIALSSAVASRVTSPWRRAGLVAVLSAALAAIAFAVGVLAPVLAGVTLVPVAGSGLLLATLMVPVHRPAPRGARLRTSLVCAAAVVLFVVTGVLHETVWSPRAKVPQRELDEIYAAIADAGETTGALLIATWAVVWCVMAATLVVMSTRDDMASWFAPRRIVALGLISIGAAGFFRWFAGFPLGMALADTFAIGGGDTAPSGVVLGLLGQLSLVAAILVGLLPAPRGYRPVAAVSTARRQDDADGTPEGTR